MGSGFERFCVMKVCSSTMLNKITKIIFEMTESFHKTIKHQTIFERGRIVRGTRQLLQKWSTPID